MKIWLIQTGEPLPVKETINKMRTAIVADKLVQRRHSVLWWASAFDHFKKDWLIKKDSRLTINKGLEIYVLKGLGYKKNISLSRLFDHRIVARKFRKLSALMEKPDIIVASMPPHDLAWESIKFSKKNSIPVLVDIRDPWPDIFLEHVPLIARRVVRIMLSKDFQMTKETMRSADGLIAATNKLLEWGLSYAGREKTSKDRVFSHGYKRFKIAYSSRVMERFKDLKEILEKKFNIFFVGTISRSYHNPFILMKAAEKMSEYEDIHFIISGDGELFEELQKKAKQHSNVTLTGWVDQNEIEYLLQHSRIGVCPSTRIIDLPTNKVFAYLSAGLPVLSAFHGEIKEIIDKYQVGLYYPPNDLDSFVNCIKQLHDDQVLYNQMSRNARRVFDEMFDADKIYEQYVDHIEKISHEYGQEGRI